MSTQTTTTPAKKAKVSTKAITRSIAFPKAVLATLKRIAKKEKRSVNFIVNEILAKALQT